MVKCEAAGCFSLCDFSKDRFIDSVKFKEEFVYISTKISLRLILPKLDFQVILSVFCVPVGLFTGVEFII